MWTLLGGAALMGLMGSPHCVGMCGGFASACATDAPSASAWHAGRLTTYGLLGLALGSVGAALPAPTWATAAPAALLVLAWGLALGGWITLPTLTVPGLSRAASLALRGPGVLGRFAFGMVTALLPCGLVYGALGLSIAAATPSAGAASMIAFGIGTTPLLAAASLGLRRWSAGGVWRRRALAAAVVVTGLGSIGLRARMPVPAPDAPADAAPPSCH